jgi:predicted dehydrogenase
MADGKPLKLACIGCGARAQTYAALAARRPDRFEIVAGADPVPERVEKLRGISGRADFRGFPNAEALLAAGKLADVAIVATQDNDHYRCCTGALRLGYNVLLEKPISTRVEQVLEIERLARQMDRRVMVCFVLRFAAFYRKVKEIIHSGALGELASIQASEGVMPWRTRLCAGTGRWWGRARR